VAFEKAGETLRRTLGRFPRARHGLTADQLALQAVENRDRVSESVLGASTACARPSKSARSWRSKPALSGSRRRIPYKIPQSVQRFPIEHISGQISFESFEWYLASLCFSQEIFENNPILKQKNISCRKSKIMTCLWL
jgi:hypothetical protein